METRNDPIAYEPPVLVVIGSLEAQTENVECSPTLCDRIPTGG